VLPRGFELHLEVLVLSVQLVEGEQLVSGDLSLALDFCEEFCLIAAGRGAWWGEKMEMKG
jgi:hypothetical protein